MLAPINFMLKKKEEEEDKSIKGITISNEMKLCVRCGERYYESDNIGTWKCIQGKKRSDHKDGLGLYTEKDDLPYLEENDYSKKCLKESISHLPRDLIKYKISRYER